MTVNKSAIVRAGVVADVAKIKELVRRLAECSAWENPAVPMSEVTARSILKSANVMMSKAMSLEMQSKEDQAAAAYEAGSNALRHLEKCVDAGIQVSETDTLQSGASPA